MGMMKEHVRGPIRCCETLARDILLQVRAEQLVSNANFNAIHSNLSRRGLEDKFEGVSRARFLGAPVVHTSKEILRLMLKQVLEELPNNHNMTWELDDYGHEDLELLEYNKVKIGSSTQFTVDWNTAHRKTADYFLYYTEEKQGLDPNAMEDDEPQKPSLEVLGSLELPPPDYIQEMSDFFYHQYVGQVWTRNILPCIQFSLFTNP